MTRASSFLLILLILLAQGSGVARGVHVRACHAAGRHDAPSLAQDGCAHACHGREHDGSRHKHDGEGETDRENGREPGHDDGQCAVCVFLAVGAGMPEPGVFAPAGQIDPLRLAISEPEARPASRGVRLADARAPPLRA